MTPWEAPSRAFCPLTLWTCGSPEGQAGLALQAVPGSRPSRQRCRRQLCLPGRLEGPPATRTHGWALPSCNLAFLPVQCKLEQQACLSSKQLTVRCEGPCPCPTEQTPPSTTDGKPGNVERWATARPGQGWGASLPASPVMPPSGLWDGKSRKGESGKNRDGPEGAGGLGGRGFRCREQVLCVLSARG